MLEQLHIKNVALIEETEIAFHPGLNILTGETGAGKSMVIDAVNFALGERTGREFLRQGAEQAEVEALFAVTDPGFSRLLEEQGVPAEEDGSLLIRRTMSQSGKTVNKVNGSTVTAGMLKKLSENLLDIHGQHEHQSLLHQTKHLGLLDRFCGQQLLDWKQELAVQVEKHQGIREKLSSMLGAGEDKERLASLLQYQIDEIAAANVTLGEEEALTARKKRLSNSEKIQSLAGRVIGLLFGENGAVDRAGEAAAALRKLSGLDESAEELTAALEEACAQMEDAGRSIKDYARSLESDPQALHSIEERLDALYRLKRKYGGSIEAVLAQYETFQEQLEELEGGEEKRRQLLAEQAACEEIIYRLCGELTGLRQEKAEAICGQVEAQLKELSMPNARFFIDIRPKETFSKDGMDRVEFLISPNLGEDPKPLSKIASGGEMSRVMLALKAVLGAADSIETFIFDEIDAGVSGRAAQKVGDKLAQIGEVRQVICVTHLPQIAAKASAHYRIEKEEAEGRTKTRVTLLDDGGALREIARLMGGETITETTLQAARELKFGL